MLTLFPENRINIFTGQVNIEVAVLSQTDKIVLHSKGLAIESVKVNNITGSFLLDPTYELLIIQKNDNGHLDVGNATIEIVFSGDMKNRIVGLYTSSYKGANGKNR